MVLPLGSGIGRAEPRETDQDPRRIAREELFPVRFVPLLPGKAHEL